jgi:multidrug resistance efflux pump
MRLDAQAFRENTVYTQDGDPVKIHANAARMEAAASAIHTLRAQLSAREAELANVKAARDEYAGLYAARCALLAIAETERDQARAAVWRYGGHRQFCYAASHGDPCACGFTAANAASAKAAANAANAYAEPLNLIELAEKAMTYDRTK